MAKISGSTLTLFLILISTFLVKGQDSSIQGKTNTGSPVPVTISSNLYILFTPTKDNNDSLYKIVHSSETKVRKIIFQFYVDHSGTIRLVVYGAKKHNKKFDKGNSFFLDRVSTPYAHEVISGDVTLGDLEISRFNGGIQRLDSMLNADKRPQFILFVPKINYDEEMKKRAYVTYTLVPVDALPKSKEEYDKYYDKDFLKGTTTIPTNPSPPRGGN